MKLEECHVKVCSAIEAYHQENFFNGLVLLHACKLFYMFLNTELIG